MSGPRRAAGDVAHYSTRPETSQKRNSQSLVERLNISQALDEQQEMQRRHAQNRTVLENVLPSHVATTIMEDRVKNDLYNEVRLRI